jgi:UPF0755 protein
MRKAILGLIILILLGGLGAAAARLAMFAYNPLEPGSQAFAIVEVPKGLSPAALAHNLATAGAIRDERLFRWTGRLLRVWPRVKAGEYKVGPGMTPLEIFSVLTSGISVSHPVTVREGENMFEVADELEKQRLAPRSRVLELCRSAELIQSAGLEGKPPSLEGYLFPDTYFFNRTMTPEDMLRQMLKRFRQAWLPEFDARAKALRMTQHQILTLASIVEKETGAPAERPLISSVFMNRLRKGMKLQSDPTTIYGMWETYKGNIRREDLLAVNGYNTYAIPALPAGPIGNPGTEAIRAVLFPAQSDYLYFVSHNDGTHQFSRTLEEHNLAVKRYQMDPRAREGRSWRDLGKGARGGAAGGR